MTAGRRPMVVLVHGAWHDSWCWNLVGRHLTDAGVEWLAPDLAMDSLRADQQAVRRLFDDSDRDVVAVGHSRGGRVISFASFGAPTVKHLIFLASDVPDAGKADLPGRRRMPLADEAIVPVDGDYTVIDKRLAPEFFYGDCPPDQVAQAVARLRPTRTETDADLVGLDVGWKAIPSTFVLSTQDKCVNPDDQRRVAVRTQHLVELASSHSPMLSMPAAVARVIVDRIEQIESSDLSGQDYSEKAH